MLINNTRGQLQKHNSQLDIRREEKRIKLTLNKADDEKRDYRKME